MPFVYRAGSQMAATYRPLDISKNEIRLLSFENTSEDAPVRLRLHYLSLDDYKPSYAAFRDERPPAESAELAKAWSEQVDMMLDTPPCEVYDNITRFLWGDYICLSYAQGGSEGETTIVFLDGVPTIVGTDLEAALRDMRSAYECQLGMKLWVHTLCINQADVADRNAHVLRVRDIFAGAFSVTAWTTTREDILHAEVKQSGEWLFLCEVIMVQYGREVLEELLGVRERNWGEMEDQDAELKNILGEIGVLMFDRYHWAESRDEAILGFNNVHLRDAVRMELRELLQKAYWSRLWIIQELAVSPTTTTVQWGTSAFSLSTLDAVCDILLAHSASCQSLSLENWIELHRNLDLLLFITTWSTREDTADGTESLDDDTVRELNLLARRARCPLRHDQVYGLLGLFPSSVTSAVTINYARQPEAVIAEFRSAVPGWNSN